MNITPFQKGIFFSIIIHLMIFTFLFLYHWQIMPGAASSEIEVISIEQNGNDVFSNPDGEDIKVPFELPKFGDDTGKTTESHDFSPTNPSNSNDRIRMNVMRADAPTELGRNNSPLMRGNPRGASNADYQGPVARMSAKSLTKQMDSYTENIRGNSPYYLEGDLSENNVVYKKIPEYPKGVDKNDRVVLQFSVFPNGKVDPNSVIVLKKADPRMDDLSVESLIEWKFTPFMGRQIRKGKITFVYQIK